MNARQLMETAPVIPVIVIDDIDTAVPLAEALIAGGLPVLEITLRTSVALQAIERVSRALPDALVGVGTVTSADDVSRSIDAGAKFAVSPGYTKAIGKACNDAKLPLLPGVMTSSDILQATEDGYSELKFFPAQQAGGVPMLKALAGPFVDTVFCPTGGINEDNYQDFLQLPNVVCVGGSWVAPKQLVAQGKWSDITALASKAVSTLKQR